jgi:hypothetical protein
VGSDLKAALSIPFSFSSSVGESDTQFGGYLPLLTLPLTPIIRSCC